MIINSNLEEKYLLMISSSTKLSISESCFTFVNNFSGIGSGLGVCFPPFVIGVSGFPSFGCGGFPPFCGGGFPPFCSLLSGIGRFSPSVGFDNGFSPSRSSGSFSAASDREEGF